MFFCIGFHGANANIFVYIDKKLIDYKCTAYIIACKTKTKFIILFKKQNVIYKKNQSLSGL